MFSMSITMLLVAVLTDTNKNSEFEKELGIAEDITENTRLGAAIRDSIR